MTLTLYVGSKRYSTWSLRPYLALAHATKDVETKLILLDQPETRSQIEQVNPAGRLPVLHHGDVIVWDSLAICEYAAELFPAAKLWPEDRSQRARARSISAEMHAGFAAMRENMSMDLCASKPGEGHTPEALVDVARIQTIWRECLTASGGPFLFGTFTIADAMFAPVVTRFRTYGVAVDDQLARYMETIRTLPAMLAWQKDAESEPKTR